MANLLDLPQEAVKYPFILSIDNDKRHAPVIRLMLSREAPYPQVQADDEDAQDKLCPALKALNISEHCVVSRTPARGGMRVVPPFCVACAQEEVPEDSEHVASQDRLYGPRKEDKPVLTYLRILPATGRRKMPTAVALASPARHRLHWRQIAPLPTRTPELHAAVENANATVKATWNHERGQLGRGDARLNKVATYQEWCDRCDEVRLSGDNGRHHIQRSIEKVCILAEWIGADEDQCVVVPTSLWTHKRARGTQGMEGGQAGTSDPHQQVSTMLFKGLAGAKPDARYCC